jgi:hypothetical protein
MNWIKKLFNKKAQKQCAISGVVGSKPTELEAPSLNIDGSFIKADKFEQIWIEENVHSRYRASDSLRDSDYIDYHIWEDQNSSKIYKKHLPNAMVIRGSNPNIIFHGGCLGCISQRNHGIDRCKGCKYFRANWSNPNLHIEGEEADTMNEEDFKRLLGGE